MRKITNNFFTALLVLTTLDLLIVMIGLAQIGIEGRTGNWAFFWRVQAEFIIKILT